MYCPSRCRYRTDQLGARNYLVSREVVQGPEWKYAKLRSYQSPWYSVCIIAMVISKGSYGHGEFKNVLPQSVQIPYLPLRGSKVPRFIGGSIGPRMEICETSALPIYVISRLHQSNGYIKRKLQAWRVQKCIALVDADIVLITAWPQSTPFHGGSIGPRMEICETSALPITMVPRLRQSNGYIKRKLREWRVRKCIALVGTDTVLTIAWKQSTPFQGGQYRAQNGNMRNFGPTNSHGIAFAPKQWLYEKEATGKESSKMYCPSRCRYRTDQLGARNYLVSREVVQGPEWKYAKLRPYPSPWYRVCTKAMVISKGSYGHGEFKNVLPQLVQISYLSLRGTKVPRFIGVVQGPEWKYAKLRPYQS